MFTEPVLCVGLDGMRRSHGVVGLIGRVGPVAIVVLQSQHNSHAKNSQIAFNTFHMHKIVQLRSRHAFVSVYKTCLFYVSFEGNMRNSGELSHISIKFITT